ncbi:MAG TPA: carbohydrate binding domain-containing protein, partial [Spirochaetales bacterium]|nr:carbohydrate binding domain-containing protein [Spirochaetales bacterium]
VWEWCQDGDPFASRPYRVSRGGSWLSDRPSLSVSYVNAPTLRYTNSWVGLRVARTPSSAVISPPAGTNLLANGDFERSGWWGVYFDPAASEGTWDSSKGEAYIQVKKGGSVQLGYRGTFNLEPGIRYELSFTYSGTSGHTIRANIEETGLDSDSDGSLYTYYYESSTVCQPTPKQAKMIVRVDKPNRFLRINMHVGDASGVWVRIDNVQLRVLE